MPRIVKKTPNSEPEPVGPPKNGVLVTHTDLIYMIAPYVHPSGLVELSQTCSTFRNILKEGNLSKLIWKASRDNLEPEGLPDCPEGMPEYDYEEMVFGTTCQGCRRRIKNQQFCFEVGLRLCPQCWKTGRRFTLISNADPLLKCVMFRRTSGFTRGIFDPKSYARRDQLLEVRGGLAAIEAAYEGEDREREKEAYMERAETACLVKKAHACLLSRWLNKAQKVAELEAAEA